MKTRDAPNFRNVAYLCYTPRERATKTVIKKRIKAFEEKRTTNHLPEKSILFAKTPRTYGKSLAPITEIDDPEVNDFGRRLIGYE
ncbi:MAG: hypothetical protein ACMG6E_04530 [Candidatus Roizmanbacteria bacterium]